MAREPPTSGTLSETPLTSCARPWMVRPVGTCSRISAVITSTLALLETSTVGDAPVTVIASSMAPTSRVALSVPVKSTRSSTASCRCCLKPGSVKVTV